MIFTQTRLGLPPQNTQESKKVEHLYGIICVFQVLHVLQVFYCSTGLNIPKEYFWQVF